MRIRKAIRTSAIMMTLVLGQAAFATPATPTRLGTPAQQEAARAWNKAHPVTPEATLAWNVLRPWSEAETSGYVALSGTDYFELPAMRQAIASHLPSGVTLIVYVSNNARLNQVKNQLGAFLGERLKFVMTPGTGDPIWARDSLPFPVYTGSSSYGLVASIYPQNFDPNAAFQQAFGYPMVKTNQVFRGGNLLFDMAGNCFSENANETASLSNPQAFFTDNFGCKSVTLLDPDGGIGDIDERLKFLSGNVVLTDSTSYATLLRNRGYDVRMMPRPAENWATYMNTLLVNGTMYVPQLGLDGDAEALQAFRDQGFNVVGIDIRQLESQGDGGIHCTTMNYPVGAFVPVAGDPDLVELRHP